MIDHISLPVSDYARSRAFYDKALGALGFKVAMEITDAPDFIGAGYGALGAPEPVFWIGAARVPGAAPVSPDGQHIAFRAGQPCRRRCVLPRDAGRRRHATMALPGLRPHYHPSYYAAFVLDPDGHRLEAVCHRPE